MIKQCITILTIVFSVSAWSQDIHFTQLNGSPLMVNPGFTGLYRGWERVSVNHKNQWVNAGTKFYTTAIAMDFNLLKSPRKRGAFLGFGIQLYNDVGGDSKFGRKQLLLSLAGIVPVAKDHFLSLGFQGGMGQTSGSFDNLVFPNQFNGSTLDPGLTSYEFRGLNSQIYPDLSFGLLYRYGGIHRSFSTTEQPEVSVGMAMYHFNKPDVRYDFGSFEEINRKMVFNATVKKDFSSSYIGFEALVNHFNQAPHSETLIAGLMRYKKSTGSQITRLKKKVVLAFGLAYRVNDAVAPVFKLENGDWTFGLSYDVTVSALGGYNRGGGLEFTLMFNNTDFALFKRKF